MPSSLPKKIEESQKGIPPLTRIQVINLAVASLQSQPLQPAEQCRKTGEVIHKERMVSTYVIVSADAILTDGKSLLLISRNADNPLQSARLPGGMLDAADSVPSLETGKYTGLTKTVLRELAEETSVRVPPAKAHIEMIGEPAPNIHNSVREVFSPPICGMQVGDLFTFANQFIIIRLEPALFQEATAQVKGRDDAAWAGVGLLSDIATTEEEQRNPAKVRIPPHHLQVLQDAGILRHP